MQWQRYSKILQSDYFGASDRAVGMPILQSHGNLVSRGDLITQDNISAPDVFTITINKNNFSQLCTVGNPGQLAGYTFNPISGNIAVDSSGIYASSCGSGTGYHGPVFYTILPKQLGGSDQYWHVIYKYYVENPSDNYEVSLYLRVAFAASLYYHDPFALRSDGATKAFYIITSSGTSAGKETQSTSKAHSDTLKVYHYTNNNVKFYLNGSKQLDAYITPSQTKTSVLSVQIYTNSTYSVPYHRIQEITISTDPSYDPQP